MVDFAGKRGNFVAYPTEKTVARWLNRWCTDWGASGQLAPKLPVPPGSKIDCQAGQGLID
jgi:hypothetical protein